MSGSAGRSQALQVHVNVSEKLPRGEACLRSDRHHTSRYLSFQPSLCISYKTVLIHSLSALLCPCVCIQNTPLLQENCFYLSWICGMCRLCFSLTKNCIIHLIDAHIVPNPCGTQNKICVIVYRLLFPMQKNQLEPPSSQNLRKA